MRTILAFLILSAVPASAALRTQDVEYRDGDKTLQGYFAYDDSFEGKRPAVMVVHEWQGLGPYARRRADQLAGLGYLAFAADMYGKGVYAKDHAEAAKLAGAVKGDRAMMRRRAWAGVETMLNHKLADPERTAAIGYCFGGTAVLELARAGYPLQGVVSFHGALDTPEPDKTRGVKARILVLHGDADEGVNPAVPGFQKEMREAKADWQMVVYSGAAHGFTNRDNTKAYNETADKRSWRAMKDFFEEIFR